jgi:hypothetical protein
MKKMFCRINLKTRIKSLIIITDVSCSKRKVILKYLRIFKFKCWSYTFMITKSLCNMPVSQTFNSLNLEQSIQYLRVFGVVEKNEPSTSSNI